MFSRDFFFFGLLAIAARPSVMERSKAYIERIDQTAMKICIPRYRVNIYCRENSVKRGPYVRVKLLADMVGENM